jgi:predicted nucleic acid-binding protein
VIVAVFSETPGSEPVRALLEDSAYDLVTPLHCLGEVWRVATEPGGLNWPPDETIAFLNRWLTRAPLIFPGERFFAVLADVVQSVQPRGAAIYDCQIAANCVEHGVEQVWTFDQRFPQLPTLRAVDPFTVRPA